MCKILTLSNASKVKNQDKLIKVAAELLSDYERDGFGYVAQGEKGFFGERTLSPSKFKTAFGLSNFDAPFVTSQSNTFGQKTKITGAALFHGRTSTNDKTLRNTHPINKRGWSLIHNGVVTNHGPDYKMDTTNDTEHLLEYISTVGVSGIEQHLTGYYAICALDPNGTLHILRDSTATLYVAKVDSIDSFIFATNEDLIEDLCEALKWKHSVIKVFRDNSYITLKGTDILSFQEIKPRGRTYFEDQYSSKSLGWSLTDSTVKTSAAPSIVRSNSEDPLSGLYECTTDEDCFLYEVNNIADETYKFLTFNNVEITYADFMDLTDKEKLDYQVFRPDGTEVNPYQYENPNFVPMANSF